MIRAAAVFLACALPAGACTVPDAVAGAGDYAAWYSDLTDRYPHGALGDAFEPETLQILTPKTRAECGLKITLDAAHVFEDTAPRLADLDGDGVPEFVTVRSHQSKGAQIAVYRLANGETGLELDTTTPYIGTRNRWLAPVGIGDLDGDGNVEIAYIDRPHLAKILRVWRYSDGALVQIAAAEGLTNHRFGAPDIAGGLRDCGGLPMLVTADAAWRQMLGTMLTGDGLQTQILGPFTTDDALNAAMECN